MDQLYRGFLICENTCHLNKPLLVSFLFPVDGVCQRTGRVTTDEEGRWLWGVICCLGRWLHSGDGLHVDIHSLLLL